MKFKSLLVKLSNFSMGRVAILGGIVTVMYFLSFYDTGESVSKEIDALKSQVSDEMTKKVETERLLKKEEQMRADVALLAKTYEDVKGKIPLDFDAPELRAIIDQVSSAIGLEVIKFDNNVGTVVNQSLVGSEDANLIDQVAVKYVFQGNYIQISKFITQLSTVQKIIKIEDARLGFTSGSKEGPARQLSFDATIIGYKQAPETNLKEKTEVK
jgi:Tfp pilus assembly protein PilO